MQNTSKANNDVDDEEELDEFVGATAKKGSQYKARPNWKLKEDSIEHNKVVQTQKKQQKKQKLAKKMRAEKREIDRPKMIKRKLTDVDTSLAGKYLQYLHSNDDSQPKFKRSKWYTE